jgi:hypothetical protein
VPRSAGRKVQIAYGGVTESIDPAQITEIDKLKTAHDIRRFGGSIPLYSIQSLYLSSEDSPLIPSICNT